MELKDKKGKTKLRFSNFKKLYKAEPIFIETLIEVNLENAISKDNVSLELLDIELLLKNLKNLNEGLENSFYFQDIDERFQIKFEPLTGGSINIKGFLKDKLYLNSLLFSFEVTLFEIDCLIIDIRSVLRMLEMDNGVM